MTDLNGKTMLITGATDGIGRLTAEGLAAQSAQVLVHGRSEERIAQAVDEIARATGNDRVRGYRADFASFAEVREMGERIGADHPRIHVLVNNAGIALRGSGSADRRLSEDGHELCFQVNYLASFLLTHLLLPRLAAAAPARIVNVASIGQAAIDFDDPNLESGYDGMRAYCQSKLALILLAIDLAETLESDRVSVNAMHPGTLLNTKMVRQSFGRALGEPEEGADAEIHLATSPDLVGVTGKYFDQMREARADPQAYDAAARSSLRELSVRLTGVGAA